MSILGNLSRGNAPQYTQNQPFENFSSTLPTVIRNVSSTLAQSHSSTSQQPLYKRAKVAANRAYQTMAPPSPLGKVVWQDPKYTPETKGLPAAWSGQSVKNMEQLLIAQPDGSKRLSTDVKDLYFTTLEQATPAGYASIQPSRDNVLNGRQTKGLIVNFGIEGRNHSSDVQKYCHATMNQFNRCFVPKGDNSTLNVKSIHEVNEEYFNSLPTRLKKAKQVFLETLPVSHLPPSLYEMPTTQY